MTTMPPAPQRLPRLLAADGPSLRAHHQQFGALPELSARELISSLEDAHLTGRGGAGFPTARKLAAVSGRKSVVVANGAEGEPLSAKDAVLVTQAPHLVLDGLDLAADALGADSVYLYLPSGLAGVMTRALNERRKAGIGRHRPAVVESPKAFVAGEESALVRRIEGGPALPSDRTVVTATSGVRGRPTSVNNVETLAHMALIARFGPQWFRAMGDRENPGSMLVTLSGAVAEPGVVEVPTDATPADLIARIGGTDPSTVRAVLVGGYHGRWISAQTVFRARTPGEALQPVSGLGIVHALAIDECGLARTAAIAGYLADQSARQCGPCRIGLPRLAQLLDDIADGRADNTRLREVRRLVALVDGRGACRHPDGTARMIRSALDVFADDIDHHRHRRCQAAVFAATAEDDNLAMDPTR